MWSSIFHVNLSLSATGKEHFSLEIIYWTGKLYGFVLYYFYRVEKFSWIISEKPTTAKKDQSKMPWHFSWEKTTLQFDGLYVFLLLDDWCFSGTQACVSGAKKWGEDGSYITYHLKGHCVVISVSFIFPVCFWLSSNNLSS